MAKINSLKIVEEKNIIHDHLLDIIGNEFRFDHAKGIAEWLKNSMDAYRRFDVPDSEQYVVYRFKDSKRGEVSIECIDFVGMTEKDIIQAFKVWGDPEAAKRGLKKRMYGGHGNGGKFYMRQMFDHSYFITYRNGYLNIFGFNEKQKYGFADGYKNEKMKAEQALKFADLNDVIIPSEIMKKILKGKTGFTVVKGFIPFGMKNKIKVKKIIEKFKNHPQARRILARVNVSAIHNDDYIYDLIRPEEVPSMSDFEKPRIISIPKKLRLEHGGDASEIKLVIPYKFPAGKLTLRTSEEALSRGSRLGDLNRIDFLGEIGVIASYQMSELGVVSFPQANFIYGECECSILENPEEDCVKNDRAKLVENDLTRTLLAWIADQVDKLAAEISAKEQEERGEQEKKLSSAYNEILNKWKDKFMKKVFSEIFGAGGSLGTEDGSGGMLRKNLIAPENGLEFTFAATDIPVNESWPLTLKASSPKPIPFGSIINLKSNNPKIELEESKVTIKADSVKLTEDGETVAVMNINIIGKDIDEEGEIVASAGRYSDKMKIKVVKAKGGNGKKPRYPKVLLSGYDTDPLGIAQKGKVFLTARDSLVYQRPQDINHAIYWINTSSPMAEAILNREKGGVESTRWRDFLFQRYVDIFVKEALHELQKKDPENFRADVVESRIMDDLIRKIHSAAAVDLNELLFGQTYAPLDSTEEG